MQLDSFDYIKNYDDGVGESTILYIGSFENVIGLKNTLVALNFLAGEYKDKLRICFLPNSTKPPSSSYSMINLISAIRELDNKPTSKEIIEFLSFLISRTLIAYSGAAGDIDLLALTEVNFPDGFFSKKEVISTMHEKLTNLQSIPFKEWPNQYWRKIWSSWPPVGLKTNTDYILYNGRVIGPLIDGFELEDFKVLKTMELEERISSISEIILKEHSVQISKDNALTTDDVMSNLVHQTTSLLNHGASAMNSSPKSEQEPTGRINLNFLSQWKGPVIDVKTDENFTFELVAIIDPITNIGQKISSILHALSSVDGFRIRVYLNPQVNIKGKLQLNRFYRYVLDTSSFNISNEIGKSSKAIFKRLPGDPLLTLGMDVLDPWVVTPVDSVHDLDNIKLSTLSKAQRHNGVEATFELKNILVEGHAIDSSTSTAPRGLQFILGTSENNEMLDTITMANLGYIQFKANPGVWELRVREGKSRELYDFHSLHYDMGRKHGGEVADGYAMVVVDSFEGVIIYPKAKKKPGKELVDLINQNADEGGTEGLWGSFKSKMFGPEINISANETINVFSVASGHLYERFLSIMFLSVLRQTKNPVKFWVIEDFLSPSFKKFIPHLASECKFDYELVTYKWPSGLRKQTEKQRVIWGYKILFLDVLFPLSLDKVIFVDADQVVRADLKELLGIDLKGAVYGYTPFCDSRPEIEGFRFWKVGYWKSHLNGAPYHISALYVVDLKKFRQVAAGDKLRATYQQLSADPESLSNLDQDLPNNMIHQLPIFSLPQEWLWCETWCSDKELKTAKTVDLCNNPMTKEPKLERAKRILPEWEGLDNEVQNLAKKVSQVNEKKTALEIVEEPKEDSHDGLINVEIVEDIKEELHDEL